MQRILIVGGNSFVGSSFAQACSRSFAITLTTRLGRNDTLALDLTRPEDFPYDKLQAGDCILFCAAISSPDICGREPEMARQVNVLGPTYFIRRASERKCRVLLFSSDTVIGKTDSLADERTLPQPAGQYAQLKWELEQAVAQFPDVKVIRLSLVISLKDKFSSYLVSSIREEKPISLLHPLYRNAVHIHDVVLLCSVLFSQWEKHTGRLVHAAGPRCISRVGLAEHLFESLNFSGTFTVERPSAEFYQHRPERIHFGSLHLAGILGRAPLAIGAGYRAELANHSPIP